MQKRRHNGMYVIIVYPGHTLNILFRLRLVVWQTAEETSKIGGQVTESAPDQCRMCYWYAVD